MSATFARVTMQAKASTSTSRKTVNPRMGYAKGVSAAAARKTKPDSKAGGGKDDSNTSKDHRGKTLPPPPDTIGPYRFQKKLGAGTYGTVFLAHHQTTQQPVAIKLIAKSSINSQKQIVRIQREIRFLKLLQHPNIVRVECVFETSDYIFLVMEYVTGGELFDYIVAHKRLKECTAREFFRMVMSAVGYCHSNAVVHRDLKPENVLLDESHKVIKIIDFGFGNTFTPSQYLDTFCGSPFYAAPEMILGRKYEGPEVDMWSLGVILFALLCGHLPFDDDNVKELYGKIARGFYKAPSHLSPEAKDLIQRLITVDPKRRATLAEVMHHPWVNRGYDEIPDIHIPHRKLITDESELDEDIIARLAAFGYGREAVKAAFFGDPALTQWLESLKVRKRRRFPGQSRLLEWGLVADRGPDTGEESDNEEHIEEEVMPPNPIRATYFLFKEMIRREKESLERVVKRNARVTAAGGDMSMADVGGALESEASDMSFEQDGVEHRSALKDDGNTFYGSLGSSKQTLCSSTDPLVPNNAASVEQDGVASVTFSAPQTTSLVPPARPRPRSVSVTPGAAESIANEPTVEDEMLSMSLLEEGDEDGEGQSQGSVHESAKVVRHGTTLTRQSPRMAWKRRHERASTTNSSARKQLVVRKGTACATKMSMFSFLRPVAGNHTGTPNRTSSTRSRRRTSFFGFTLIGPGGTSSKALATTQASQTSTRPVSMAARPVSYTRHTDPVRMRIVSGWFFSVATTSRKKPRHIMREMQRAVAAMGNMDFNYNSGYILEVVCDGNANVGSKLGIVAEEKTAELGQGSRSHSLFKPRRETPAASSDARHVATPPIIFEMEICKVTRVSGMYGIRFKRLQGNLWAYKKACYLLLNELQL